MTRVETAVEYFAKGYNCAQSVFGSFSEDLGMDKATAFKLGNGFGGGVRCGDVCGAVTGAIMAIGLKCGFHIEKDFGQKAFCNEKAFEFINEFKEENGSMICREILGLDIKRPDDFTSPEAREVFTAICPEIVASAVRILESMDFEK